MEREMSDPTLYLESLHEWPHFVAHFSKMFGLHNEQMHSQAALDGTIQNSKEVFADFLVRFQDIALKTGYNEEVAFTQTN